MCIVLISSVMVGNILGERFVTLSFGESHGKCIGAVVDGCPAGLPLNEEDIQRFLDLRKPGQSIITTQRQEYDKVEILSGTFNGYTTGAPICMIVWNKDADSKSYDGFKQIPRPGHSDYPASVKYGGFFDYRGSGRFSGRLTATLVMAGSIARKLLKYCLGIDTIAYTSEIGVIRSSEVSFDNALQLTYTNDVRCPDSDAAEKMRNLILQAKREGDSVGGVIRCVTNNVPVGLGEPIFASLESDLSKAIFSIPAVKGIEFGSGFNSSRMKGSVNNDLYYMENGRIYTKTNHSGGILGGLSNGMPLIINIAFKPASSIAKKQTTLDLSSGKETELIVPGRHDPCVVPRAPPVVESVVSLILADHAVRSGFINPAVVRDLH